ncbi:MAG: DUF3450 family protein [Verrucomicrobiae bacterium]|nr:DUF3450 family protein [Verrucomicrobiae bacterium]
MNRSIVFLGLAFLACVGEAAENSSSVARARTTLEQWVQTRQLISRTRADWQADKETLEQTTQLYERELRNVAEQMGRVSTNHAQVDFERDQALHQQSELTNATETIKFLVAGLETRLKALAPSFPPPLTDKLQPLLQRLPADSAATRASGLERIQNLVGILNEVDKFNAAITVVSEVQKNPAGAEVQVETLYLGLAQAYFVDKAGEYAGVGTPTAQGWQWTEQKELAGRIQESLAMYKNAKPAAFVSLPVRIH